MEESTSSKYLIDINNYKKGQKLDKDGFGSCYSAQNKETGENYAIKIIEGSYNDEEKKKSIDKEIKKVFLLKHPTLVKFCGYSFKGFHDEDKLAMVMELAKNGSLAGLISKARHSQTDKDIDNTTKQIILIGIARGMMFLHHHHIVHRFLKMENVLLDENFHPHLTEYFLTKIFTNDQIKSQSKRCETWFYIAPEIIGDKKFSGKADVYSFGIIMYEVLTELIPYPLLKKGKLSISDFCHKVVDEDYRPSFDIPVKEPFKSLIEKCWSKNPDERPTFEDIFKKLAYQFEDSVYSTEENDSELYCLDDIDKDIVRSYVEDITSNVSQARLVELEEKVDQLDQANHQLKIKNKQLKKVNDQLNLRVSHLENMINKEILQEQQQKEQIQQSQQKEQIQQNEQIQQSQQQQNDNNSDDNKLMNQNENLHESQAIKLLREKGITINYFNALPLHSQQTVIEDIVTNSANGHLNNFFRKLNELLLFILPTDPSETASSCIEIIPVNEDTDHVTILSSATKMLYRHQLLHSDNLIKLLKEFKDISIELKYPSKSFKKAFSQVSKIKSNDFNDLKITIFISGVKKTDLTFANNKKITAVKIDWSVTSIFGGSLGGSFSGCTSLVEVFIPPSVTSIGDCAFEGCTKLATLNLPSSVNSIGYRAFDGCTALLDLTLPPSVKTIGWRAFYSCNSLSKISIPSSTASIGEEAFPKTAKIIRYVPKHIQQLNK